jgi:hypothetical protein
MQTSDSEYWTSFTGTLDEWNAKQNPPLKIVEPHHFAGGNVIEPRRAESKDGETVAYELVTLQSTVVLYKAKYKPK